MSNELLIIVYIVVAMGLVVPVHRWFGTTGLIAWSSISLITANILTVVFIPLFGFIATLGNAQYGATFLVSDALCELEGKRTARKSVTIALIAQIVFTLTIQAIRLFTPADFDVGIARLTELFIALPRITIASLAAYVVAQYHDVWMFDKIKQWKPNRKYLWIRNNLSTGLSQLFDSAVFYTVAFVGTVETTTFFQLLFTGYVIKLIVATLDTPFVYLITKSAHINR